MHTTICGDQRDGYTCTLAPHVPEVDHTEVRDAGPRRAYTAAFWAAQPGKNWSGQTIVSLYPARGAA